MGTLESGDKQSVLDLRNKVKASLSFARCQIRVPLCLFPSVGRFTSYREKNNQKEYKSIMALYCQGCYIWEICDVMGQGVLISISVPLLSLYYSVKTWIALLLGGY